MNANDTPPAVLQPDVQVELPARMDPEKLIAQAIAKKVPIETLERLLALRDKLRAEAAKEAFLEAMSRFQSHCPVIKKNKTAKVKSKSSGVEFTYKYADIGFIVSTVAPLIAECGLSYRIETKYEANPPCQVSKTIVSHVLGHSEESEFRAPIDTTAVVNDMQKAASAASFGKRQSFCNAFGILTSDQDDDGRAGGASSKGPEKREPQEKVEEPATYPNDLFLKNLPVWKGLMESGTKSADDIIATVGTRYHLSPDQIRRIRAAEGVKK